MTDEATPIRLPGTMAEQFLYVIAGIWHEHQDYSIRQTLDELNRLIKPEHMEALEKDAARYRWLRSVRPDALLNVAWSMSSEACKIGADADAAIDAAMAT